MVESREAFIEAVTEELSGVLKPYRKEVSRQQRLADFVQQCLRSASRDDFFQVDELLKAKMAADAEEEPGLAACKAPFDRLRAYANEQVEHYRIEFIEDLTSRAEEAGIPLDVDFPRFTVLKGIEGSVDFAGRRTVINGKALKSIDPRRIISELVKVKRKLYDRPFDPRAFVDGLYGAYTSLLEREQHAPGHAVPIQPFYLEYVLSLQSKVFFQNMEKGKFRGYSLDEFAVDLWRYFEAGTGGTSKGYMLQLRPGRNKALWLIDSDGERRQITGIAFQKRKP
jgi:hypothetical protein